MDKGRVAESNSEISKDAKALQERVLETEAPATMPQAEIPAQAPAETPAEQPAE
jgi:preprotein translocase subunit SecG